jgi:hypothetical protein
MLLPGNQSKETDAEPRDAAIAPRDFAGSEGPIFTASPPPRRFPAIWGGTIFTMIVFAAGVMGLARLSVHVARQAQKLEPADRPGSGIIIRSELLRFWLPQTLTELAKRQSQFRVVRTHEELQRFLELHDRKDLWCALTVRGHQVNGNFVDLTFIRRPYDDPLHFPEFLNILATAAGNPPRDPAADFSTASVHIIANDSLNREPREVIAELLGDPSEPLLDMERASAPSGRSKPSYPAQDERDGSEG